MLRTVLVLLAMTMPALAAPAHKQPPASAQPSSQPVIGSALDEKAKAGIAQRLQSADDEFNAIEASMRKAGAGICRGC